ncbi:hypothetical protein [Jiella marina]|uniref:hypothetical protein n=1 Tax=Jiella sp. LLJ827 TaxID=2917712 RepID=UPI002100E5FA|nr:hypothetical protein [Jiella sp. LLJ827]MCQ0990137.1 hypothetical protein [Jiella sp. LLJ827]
MAATEREEITDQESFKRWLEGQPNDVAQVMAVRAALRVFPLVLGEHVYRRTRKHYVDDLIRLTLTSARCLIISWAARKYPIHEMAEAAASAADTAAYAARAAIAHTAFAAHAADAAAAAADAAAAAARAAFAADAARAAAARAASAAAAAAYAAAYAAAAAADVAAGTAAWKAVEIEARWIDKGGNAGDLLNTPLWPADEHSTLCTGADTIALDGGRIAPEWVLSALESYSNDPNIRASSWVLWAEWYSALLPMHPFKTPFSAFGEAADLEIVRQSNNFWDRHPDDVMAAIASIVERRRGTVKVEDGGEDESLPDDTTLSQFIFSLLQSELREYSLDEIVAACREAGFTGPRSSIRGRVNTLTSEGRIRRVSRAIYASIGYEPPGLTSDVEIPPQERAPVETVVSDGRVLRLVHPPSTENASVATIHGILRTEADWLRGRISGQMPDATTSFDQLINELGIDLQTMNVVGAGYWTNVLAQMAARVDETLLEDAAGRFAGFVVNLDLFLKQFPEWEEYIRGAQNAELRALSQTDTEAETMDLVEALVEANDVIDSSVSDPISFLNKALLDAPVYNPETAYGFYQSLSNVLRSIAQIAVRHGPEQLARLARETGTEARKKAVSWTVGGILLGCGLSLGRLAEQVPSMFGFLGPVLKLFGVGG